MIVYKSIIRNEEELVFMSLEEKENLIKQAKFYINILNIDNLKNASFYKDEKPIDSSCKALSVFLYITHEGVMKYILENPDNKIFKSSI